MSKRKEKENELLAFLSEEERKSYEEFEKKLQAKRNVAVKRQKEEMAFWKKIDEREDEVLKHIMENREKKQQAEKLKKEQDVQKAQMQNQTGFGNVTMTKPVTENRTVPVQNQNPQMQQKPVMQNYHQGQPTGQVGGQNSVAYRQP